MKIIDKVLALIEKREMIFSFEFFPPKTAGGTENLYVRINRMSALEPTWIDVTWGAGGQTSERTLEIASNTQKYCGVDVMMHLTCTLFLNDCFGCLDHEIFIASILHNIKLSQPTLFFSHFYKHVCSKYCFELYNEIFIYRQSYICSLSHELSHFSKTKVQI